MLKAFCKLRNKPVNIGFRDGSTIGGGIASEEPKMVLLFTGVDCLWVSLEWKWNGQIVIIPASDIVCMASDRKDPS